MRARARERESDRERPCHNVYNSWIDDLGITAEEVALERGDRGNFKIGAADRGDRAIGVTAESGDLSGAAATAATEGAAAATDGRAAAAAGNGGRVNGKFVCALCTLVSLSSRAE